MTNQEWCTAYVQATRYAGRDSVTAEARDRNTRKVLAQFRRQVVPISYSTSGGRAPDGTCYPTWIWAEGFGKWPSCEEMKQAEDNRWNRATEELCEFITEWLSKGELIYGNRKFAPREDDHA